MGPRPASGGPCAAAVLVLAREVTGDGWPNTQSKDYGNHFISSSPPDVHLGHARGLCTGCSVMSFGRNGGGLAFPVHTGTCERDGEHPWDPAGTSGVVCPGPQTGTEGHGGTGRVLPVPPGSPLSYSVCLLRACGSRVTGVTGWSTWSWTRERGFGSRHRASAAPASVLRRQPLGASLGLHTASPLGL